ncbi:hypothetical protein ERX46_03720 [Brumimicrobium glaciale]|jgi:hypothetical protein|uniref:Lipoprotein n=1 Tax=Brumimicrobium glaciale TaxID=200475 RepID=A0A4Q4KSR4_9FLAO|nr:hypothetical protein [Brumimicrobium glaciale]RYM36115.1 hypothetical protein ERX46_03720 [Brumimicrobium glaciale]
MKTIKLLSLGLFVAGAMLFSSCKKEGCTNPTANNYDAKAKTSDGSCIYTAEVVFWFKENLSIALQNAEIKELNYSLNGEPLGKSGTDKFWEEAPECETAGTIKFSKELTKSNSEPFYCKIVDKEGVKLWEELITLDTDSCRIILLDSF